MRPPLHGDAVALAIVLRRAPRPRRDWVMHRVLREADRAADLARAGAGGHPLWGDGSLMAAALRRGLSSEPALEERDYCRCLARVYAALAER
ncbi:hypothetical protein ACRDNQ_13845 [Palleronia sp. KMU-117]|uniref:DUF7742 family protein n=1 Tax=Palleronia sp. KMU-117 TaxID=3434108 RepID=UPI003D741E9B